MRCIAIAAPNPLSMFTTVTPDAQLVSIAKQRREPAERARRTPPTWAPRSPVREMSPPTTLGSAPSIPATTMTPAAASRSARAVEQAVNARDADVVALDRLDAQHAQRLQPPLRPTGISPVPAVTTATLPPGASRWAPPRASRCARSRWYLSALDALAARAPALARIEARDEHVLPGARQLLGDRRDLLGGLALAEDHLGHAGAERAVVIDGREPEIAERQLAQLGSALRRWRGSPRADRFQERLDALYVHAPRI